MSPGAGPWAATPRATRARFSSSVHLTKGEVFTACQALADADRVLVRSGLVEEAHALGDLFELFEERLSAVELGRPPC